MISVTSPDKFNSLNNIVIIKIDDFLSVADDGGNVTGQVELVLADT